MNLEMLIELCADTGTKIVIIDDDEDKETEDNDE